MADNEQQFDDDQWLSAYLDGELTGEQRAAVEQRLRDDPHARQLLDEFRDVSTALQTLPREVVGDDLREKIYAAAEKRRENEPSVAGGARRWRWAALALAATLVLAIYLPEDNRDKQPLAQAEPRQRDIALSAPKLEAPTGENRVAHEEIAAFKSAPKIDVSSSMGAFANAGQGGRKIEAEQHLLGLQEDDTVAGTLAESHVPASPRENSRPSRLDVPHVGEVLQIHVALGDDRKAAELFDRLLAAQGIVFQESEGGFADRQRSASARSFERKLKNDVISDLQDEESYEADFVLVEAPPEQIEGLLNAFHDDPDQWKSLRLEGEGNAAVPLARWQRLQRGGAFGGNNFGTADTPADRGVVAAIESLPAADNSTSSVSKDRKKTSPQGAGKPIGWAVRVGRTSSFDALRATDGDRSEKIAALRSEARLSKEQDKRADSDLEQGASIRVLFILHPGREESKSGPTPVTKKKS